MPVLTLTVEGVCCVSFHTNINKVNTVFACVFICFIGIAKREKVRKRDKCGLKSFVKRISLQFKTKRQPKKILDNSLIWRDNHFIILIKNARFKIVNSTILSTFVIFSHLSLSLCLCDVLCNATCKPQIELSIFFILFN